jgi:hypothetical protein
MEYAFAEPPTSGTNTRRLRTALAADQPADFGNKIARDQHHGQAFDFHARLVFSQFLVFGLLVVRKKRGQRRMA